MRGRGWGGGVETRRLGDVTGAVQILVMNFFFSGECGDGGFFVIYFLRWLACIFLFVSVSVSVHEFHCVFPKPTRPSPLL